jgi:hypothetical protein
MDAMRRGAETKSESGALLDEIRKLRRSVRVMQVTMVIGFAAVLLQPHS